MAKMTTLEILALADSVKDCAANEGHRESAKTCRDDAWALMNGKVLKNVSHAERERCARRRAVDAIEYNLGCLDKRAIEARAALDG